MDRASVGMEIPECEAGLEDDSSRRAPDVEACDIRREKQAADCRRTLEPRALEAREIDRNLNTSNSPGFIQLVAAKPASDRPFERRWPGAAKGQGPPRLVRNEPPAASSSLRADSA